MGFRKTWVLGAALCGALLCGANSRAGTISFIADGTFMSSGAQTSSSGNSTVTYDLLGLQTATTPTNVSLGNFTSSTAANRLGSATTTGHSFSTRTVGAIACQPTGLPPAFQSGIARFSARDRNLASRLPNV